MFNKEKTWHRMTRIYCFFPAANSMSFSYCKFSAAFPYTITFFPTSFISLMNLHLIFAILEFGELDFFPTLNWIFLPVVACKIQIWNRLKIQLIKLNISNWKIANKVQIDRGICFFPWCKMEFIVSSHTLNFFSRFRLLINCNSIVSPIKYPVSISKHSHNSFLNL